MYKITEKKEGELENQTAAYICPVIGLEMSGKFRFVALWSCGCVFSERALKEINTNVCHKVGIFRNIELYVLLTNFYCSVRNRLIKTMS